MGGSVQEYWDHVPVRSSHTWLVTEGQGEVSRHKLRGGADVAVKSCWQEHYASRRRAPIIATAMARRATNASALVSEVHSDEEAGGFRASISNQSVT